MFYYTNTKILWKTYKEHIYQRWKKGKTTFDFHTFLKSFRLWGLVLCENHMIINTIWIFFMKSVLFLSGSMLQFWVICKLFCLQKNNNKNPVMPKYQSENTKTSKDKTFTFFLKVGFRTRIMFIAYSQIKRHGTMQRFFFS